MNLETNCGPLSEMIWSGSPWSHTTLSMRRQAAPCDVSSMWVGTRWMAFDNLSTMVRTTLYPSDSGNGLTRSQLISCHGQLGIGIGCRLPVGWQCAGLTFWHVWHPFTYCSTSFLKFGHQYCRSKRSRVFTTPGCPARGAS